MAETGTRDATAVREQLQRILASPGFVHSERLRRFLTHCVEATLAGRIEDLKEYVIGVTAFDRPTHYNPAEDPIVRVEARRLRKKLDEYYQATGAKDLVVIQIPKGAYLPTFEILKPAAPVKKPESRKWMMLAAPLVCATGIAVWIAGRPSARIPELVLSRLTSDSGLTTDPAFAPDGSLLAYASDRANSVGLDIWLQRLTPGPARQEPKRLTDDSADDSEPAISPDGKTVLFRSERQNPGIYRVAVEGGLSSLVAADGRNPRYSPDGQWIAYWIGSPGGDFLPPAGTVYVMASSGGVARPLASGLASSACPVWSPDGKRLLVEGVRSPGGVVDLWTVPWNSGRATATGIVQTLQAERLSLIFQECSFSWADGAVTIAASRGDTENLWRLRLSAEGRLSGLTRLTFGSAEEALPSAVGEGAIAFTSRSVRLNVWRVAAENPQELERVTRGVGTAAFPDVRAVPGGIKLAFLSKAEGRSAIWLQDVAGGGRAPVAPAASEPRYPQVCADGETVVYNDGPDAYRAKAGAGQTAVVCPSCGRLWHCAEKELFYVSPAQGGRLGISAMTLQDGAKRTLLASPQNDLAGARLSSDGWLAFHVIAGQGARQIFVAPRSQGQFEIPQSDWIAVTDGAHLDRNAAWNDRGDTLYFLSERCGFRCIWAQRLDGKTKRPVGSPWTVRHFHSARQGLSAIGDVGAIGLGYAGGYLYFTLADQSGDIWLGKPGGPVSSGTQNR